MSLTVSFVLSVKCFLEISESWGIGQTEKTEKTEKNSHFHISTTAFARAPSGVRKDSTGFDVGVTSVNVVHSVAIRLLPWPALRLSDFFFSFLKGVMLLLFGFLIGCY